MKVEVEVGDVLKVVTAVAVKNKNTILDSARSEKTR